MAGAAAGGRFEMARAVVIYSPAYAHLLDACVEDLQGSPFGKDLLSLQTVAGGWEANVGQLADHLQPGDVLAVIGGEGTFGDVAGALISKEIGDVGSEVGITSIDGGGGHDIRRATHRAWPRSPSWRLAHSRVHKAWALNVTLQHADGEPAQHQAFSYAGLGRSAEQTPVVAGSEYKNDLPVWRDFKIAMGILASKTNFKIEDNQGTSGWLAELDIVKGGRMGKASRWPIRHQDEAFLVKTTPDHTPTVLLTAAQLLTNTVTGYRRATDYGFVVQTPTQMHVDGEPPIELAAQTTVRVGLSDRNYNLLASK